MPWWISPIKCKSRDIGNSHPVERMSSSNKSEKCTNKLQQQEQPTQSCLINFNQIIGHRFWHIFALFLTSIGRRGETSKINFLVILWYLTQWSIKSTIIKHKLMMINYYFTSQKVLQLRAWWMEPIKCKESVHRKFSSGWTKVVIQQISQWH